MWGYAFAVTSHSSQGATADRVLVHVDTEQAHDQLINSRLACVSVSRFCAESTLLRRVLEERVGHSDAGNDLSVRQVFA